MHTENPKKFCNRSNRTNKWIQAGYRIQGQYTETIIFSYPSRGDLEMKWNNAVYNSIKMITFIYVKWITDLSVKVKTINFYKKTEKIFMTAGIKWLGTQKILHCFSTSHHPQQLVLDVLRT